MEYVAFLLGINVGGRQVKMEDLKKVFGKAGFKDVRTVIASGNVLFSGGEGGTQAIGREIELALKKKFGFDISVIVRPLSDIEKMVHANPFKSIHVTPNTRLYVTFLSEKPTSTVPPKSAGGLKILKVTSGEVYGVITLSKEIGTTDAMNILAKTYGKKITTRNWNTLVKIVSMK